jgi:hypothetical protein
MLTQGSDQSPPSQNAKVAVAQPLEPHLTNCNLEEISPKRLVELAQSILSVVGYRSSPFSNFSD